jgi:hypothetical protein
MLLHKNVLVSQGEAFAETHETRNPFRICWPGFPPDADKSTYFAVLWSPATETLHWFKRLRLRTSGAAPERADTCTPFLPATHGPYSFAVLKMNPGQRMPPKYMLKRRQPWTLRAFAGQFPMGLTPLHQVDFSMIKPPD